MISKTLEKALGELRAAEQKLRTRYEALTKERKRTVATMENKSTIKARISAAVDQAGARWRKETAHSIISGLSAHQGKSALPALSELSLHALCALVPELVRESLAAVVDGHDYVEGPPAEDRADILARIDAELAEVCEAHEALVAEAAILGIVVKDLPDAAARRLEAERETQREELRRQSEERQAMLGPNPMLISTQEVQRAVDAPTIRH